MNKNIRSKCLYSGKFLELYLDSIKQDNGKIINWERCSRKNKINAVMIVPYHIKNKTLIMISEYRIPIKGFEIGFPAGLMDHENESIENVIRRELKEETGYDLVKINRISPMCFNSSGMTDETISIAYVDVLGESSSKFLENDEEIITFEADKNTIIKLLNATDIKWGAKAWIICDNFLNQNIFN